MAAEAWWSGHRGRGFRSRGDEHKGHHAQCERHERARKHRARECDARAEQVAGGSRVLVNVLANQKVRGKKKRGTNDECRLGKSTSLGGDDALVALARAPIQSGHAPVEDRSGSAMGCASSAQVRPREWDGSSPGLASRPASALVSTSGRTAGRFGASPRRQTLQATTPPGSPPGFCDAASTRLVFAGAGDSGFQAARSPPMSPGQAVTEGMFSTTKSRKDGEKKTAPAAAGASVRPAAAGATTAATTTQAQAPPPKKKLTASQQQDADRERLRAKLHEVDDLMFKGTSTSDLGKALYV